MEKNIFEGAKLGDKFLTEDGRLAVYIGRWYDGTKDMLAYPHHLHIDCIRPDRQMYFNNKGQTKYVDGSPIVSKYDTSKSPWIKCSDRMPDWNKDTFDGYLVRTTVPTRSQGKNSVFTAVYFDGKFEIIGDKYATQKITHWMPIPEYNEEE